MAFYLFLAVDWMAFAVGSRFGMEGTEHTFADFLSSRPDTIIWLHRLTSAILGTLNIVLVFLMGRLVASTRVGLVAAFFLATAYLHVRDSHFGVVDVPMTFSLSLSLLLAMRHVNDGRLGSLLWAALVAGLATAQKYPACLLVVSLGCAHLVASRNRGIQFFSAILSWRLFLAVGAMVACFAAFSPYTLFAFQDFIGDFGSQLRLSLLPESITTSEENGWVKLLTFSLRFGLGLPLLVIALLGVVLALVRPKRNAMVLASFVLTYIAVIGAGRSTFVRYAIPLIPPLCVVAADALGRIARGIPASRLFHLVKVGVVIALVVEPLGRALVFNTVLRREDTRILARSWIDSNVGPGQTVMALPGLMPHIQQWALPRVTFIPAHPTVLLAGKVNYLAYIDDHPLFTGRFPGLDDILRRGLESSLVFEACGFENGPGKSEIFDKQDAFFVPFASFDWHLRPGPTVRIFQIINTRQATGPPPLPPLDVRATVDGLIVHLSWKLPAQHDLDGTSPDVAGRKGPGNSSALCTLVYLYKERKIRLGQGNYFLKHILPPNRKSCWLDGMSSGRFLVAVSVLSLAGEGPLSSVRFEIP